MPDLVKLRDIIVQDGVAIENWPSIVDELIQSEQDVSSIKKSLKDKDYSEAVLKTLQIWHGYGSKGDSLLGVLKKKRLHSLAKNIAANLKDQVPGQPVSNNNAGTEKFSKTNYSKI